MKIAIIVGTFPALSETFILNQITGLIDKGHKVEIFAYNRGDQSTVHEDILKYSILKHTEYKKIAPSTPLKKIFGLFLWISKNILIINWREFIHSLNFFQFGKRAYSLKLFYETKWLLCCKKIDVIHAHFGHNAREVANLKSLGFFKKSKLMVTFHGYDLNPSYIDWYKKIYKEIFKEANILTVNTPYLMKILLKVNSKPLNVKIIPVGVNFKIFMKQNFSSFRASFNILFVGRLINLKGPDVAVEIFNDLVNLGYHPLELHIAGEGPLHDVLTSRVAELGLEKVVHFYGGVSQEKVKELMDNSDVFVLPGKRDDSGRAETQGLVIQEAQAMELPVIVSDVGGMKYGLVNGKTGIVVEEGNKQKFVTSIEKFIINRDLKHSFGTQGREFVQENYNSSVLVDRLVQLYEGLIEVEN